MIFYSFSTIAGTIVNTLFTGVEEGASGSATSPPAKRKATVDSPLQQVKIESEVTEASESESVTSQGWDDVGGESLFVLLLYTVSTVSCLVIYW